MGGARNGRTWMETKVILHEERKLVWQCPYCYGKNRVRYPYGKKEVVCHSCKREYGVKGQKPWRDDED